MRTQFTSSDLKLYAMGAMVIDHGALALLYWTGYHGIFPWSGIYTAMRLIGRMAFPLFAFLLVEGFLHTRDWKWYGFRLAVLAVLSEIPFNLLASRQIFYPGEQNTVMTLLLGLLTLAGVAAAEQKISEAGTAGTGKNRTGQGRNTGAEKNAVTAKSHIAMLFIAPAGVSVARFLRTDYGTEGVLLILIFYWFRYNPIMRMAAGAVLLFLSNAAGLDGVAPWIAFFFINRYNGEKGSDLSWLPYWFYPVHLILLYAAGAIMNGTYI